MTAGNDRLSIALDLGSTRIKLGALDDEAKLLLLDECASPPVTGSGLVRESDPMLWLDAAGELLATAGADLPLGISSQRSSFLLWRRDDGHAQTPLISWQDRRARDWCVRHAHLQPLLVQRAGLRLSAHYAGPKLASLLEQRPDWRAGLASGELLFGTLDSWLVWVLSGRRAHLTDLSMAARTGMLALDTGDWCEQLLQAFSVPRACLPGIVASTGQALPLTGGTILNASLADQSASALALVGDDDSVLVNFGTGAFVLRVGVPGDQRVPGYLTAALLGNATTRFALEGTINGAGPSLDACAPAPTGLPEADLCADGFALPDRAGIGSPHWRPGLGPLLSAAARKLDGPGRRRIMLEGLLFRVHEILDDLGATSAGRILLSGGLVRDPALAPGLAALLERRVEVLADAEAGLIGAARLAAGLPPHAQVDTQAVAPTPAGSYLVDKYPRWRSWLGEALQASSASDSPQ